MEQTVVSVSDAIALLNQLLETALPVIRIEGEVASFKINQGKWVFFDVKDDEGTLPCFMSVFQLRQPIEDGMRVQVLVSPRVTQWGKLSLTVREVTPVGTGSIRRAFELLKKKLEQEGLFALERKRALPVMPSRIAVISSTQAAGYADFIRILNERWGGMHVEVAHVQVQGVMAADQIIRALSYFNEQEQLPEIIAIVRGGGSADDLSVFNDELLTRAIASSRVPVVTGVGHEVDESLADLVADVRAATPSHAAQIIVPDKQSVLREMHSEMMRAATITEIAIGDLLVTMHNQLQRAITSFDAREAEAEAYLARQRSILSAYDPHAVLERGYAIIRGNISVGATVEVERATQLITAEVKNVKTK